MCLLRRFLIDLRVNKKKKKTEKIETIKKYLKKKNENVELLLNICGFKKKNDVACLAGVYGRPPRQRPYYTRYYAHQRTRVWKSV